jgi:hypothetical protein
MQLEQDAAAIALSPGGGHRTAAFVRDCRVVPLTVAHPSYQGEVRNRVNHAGLFWSNTHKCPSA